MAIKIIRIVLDDINYPLLTCEVSSLDYNVGRESVYDTAYPNFEVVVQNALRTKLRELMEDRKHGATEKLRPNIQRDPPQEVPREIVSTKPRTAAPKPRLPKKVEGEKAKRRKR